MWNWIWLLVIGVALLLLPVLWLAQVTRKPVANVSRTEEWEQERREVAELKRKARE